MLSYCLAKMLHLHTKLHQFHDGGRFISVTMTTMFCANKNLSWFHKTIHNDKPSQCVFILKIQRCENKRVICFFSDLECALKLLSHFKYFLLTLPNIVKYKYMQLQCKLERRLRQNLGLLKEYSFFQK